MATPAGDSHQVASGGVIAAGRYYGTPATSLTLTDTVHPRLYQRVGTAKTLMIGGSYTGPATRIQARACPAGTGLTALESTYPFSTVVNNPTGGAFSASLSVPQGDGWVVQIRDAIDHAVGSTGTHVFGVGSFIALIGQSNMENMFSSINGWPLGGPSALGQSASAALQRIGAINDAFPPSSLSSTYGSWTDGGSADVRLHGNGVVIMSNDLVSSLGCPVGLLLWAASGSSITNWVAGQAYMTNLLGGIDAVGGDCEAAIWLQGENDTASSMSAATYQTNLQNVFDTIKSHVGRASFAFGTVIVGPGMATSGAWGSAWSAEGTLGPIRKGQIDFVAANTANGAFLAGTDIDGNLASASAIHIDQTSLFTQGRRYTEAIKRAFAGAAHNIEGPKISSASRSGAVVTVNVTQQGGTALLDGSGSSGGSLQGFRVFDGGTPMTISSTAISSNTIVLTLSATPSGTVTMDYAMANAPFGATTSPAAVCYDNQTIPGSALGLPLQPKPLFTVS